MKRQCLSSKRNKKGFTILELLIGLAIAAIVMLAIYGIFILTYRTYLGQESIADIQEDLRIAIEQMTREMRMAGLKLASYNSLTPTPPSIEEASPTRFRFTAGDMEKDGTQDRIEYSFENGNLMRTFQEYTGGAWQPPQSQAKQVIARNILSLNFRYFDVSNSEIFPGTDTTLTEQVRRVEISLTLETPLIDPILGKKVQRTIVVDVKLRNMGVEERGADIIPPSAPTGLTSTDPGECTKLVLKWNPNPEADVAGYRIYYKPHGSGTYTNIVDAGNTTTYILKDTLTTPLLMGVTYDIAIAAYDYAGNSSALSTPISGTAYPSDTTPNDNTAPFPPSIISATSDSGSVKITWNPSASADVAGYNVYKSSDNGVSWTKLTAAPLSTEVTSYTDTNVITCPAYPYIYKVTAIDCVPNEDFASAMNIYGTGDPMSGSPLGANTYPSDTIPPSDPSSFQAAAGDSEVYLSWINPTESDFAGVRIMVKYFLGDPNYSTFPANKDDGELVYQTNLDSRPEAKNPGQSLTYRHGGLVNNTRYNYRAFSYDRCGNFSAGAVSAASALPCGDASYPGPPSEPLNLTASSCGNVTLKWQAPASNAGDLIGYNIYRSTTPNAKITGIKLNTSPVTTKEFVDTTAVEGGTYYYQVTALDCVLPAHNESLPSNEVVVHAGGLTRDESVVIRSFGGSVDNPNNIYHNFVSFGIQNTSSTELTMALATVTWAINTDNIRLGRVYMKPATQTTRILNNEPYKVSGFEFSLTQAGTTLNISTGSEGRTRVIFEFTDPSGNPVDMRGNIIEVTFKYYKDGILCTSPLIRFTVPYGPTINPVTQSEPMPGTVCSPSPGDITVEAGKSVTVIAYVTPYPGTIIPSGGVKLHYLIQSVKTSTPPPPGSSYTILTMTPIIITPSGEGYYYATIPVATGKRVWFYIVATDDQDNSEMVPGVNPLNPSEFRAYVYDEKSSFSINLSACWISVAEKKVKVTVSLKDQDGNAVSGASVNAVLSQTNTGTIYNITLSETSTQGTYQATSPVFPNSSDPVNVSVTVTKTLFTTGTANTFCSTICP